MLSLIKETLRVRPKTDFRPEKISRREVQLPLHYIHFELAKVDHPNTRFLSVQIFYLSRAETKKYQSEPFKGKEKFWGQKLQKFVTL